MASAGLVIVALSTFVPLGAGSGLEYLFIAPDLRDFLLTWATLSLGLAAGRRGLLAVASRHAPDRIAEIREGRWLSPLVGLALLPLGLVPSVPGVGHYGAPAAFFLYDLRWWWCAILVAWTIVRADAAMGAPVATWIRRVGQWPVTGRRLLADSILFTLVMAWAVVTTPSLRPAGALQGDEPKYVRYCETWYQGGGLEVSGKAYFSDERLDAPPRVLATIPLLARTIGQESVDLVRDLRAFARAPRGFRWNRVEGDDGFVAGKHGGLYQIYQPGVSALLFPGYFLDRYLLGLDRGYQGEFPSELTMTDTVMLLMYGVCAVALFRLLLRTGVGGCAAAVWAAVGTMTLPAAAFAFQLYPELPAACLILMISTYALFEQSPRVGHALLAGAACGGLAWLHPRFLLVAGCLTAAAVWRTRKGARLAFVGAAAAVLSTVLLYDYRVTGSWSPTAVWDASMPEGELHGVSIWFNSIGYFVDHRWGLLPHSLILAAVLPGLALMLARAPRRASFVAVVGLSLLLPAAGHTLNAAGSTPGRLVLAVVPLLFWPIALLARSVWNSTWARTVLVGAVTISLETAAAYNWNNHSHHKDFGTILDASRSGWKPNLAFPGIRDGYWQSNGNFSLLLVMVGATALACWLAFRHAHADEAVSTPPRHVRWFMGPTVMIATIVVATLATAIDGEWTRDDYLIEPQAAVRVAAERMVSIEHCRFCFSTQRTSIDWTRLEPNAADTLRTDVEARGLALTLRVTLPTHGGQAAFGRVRVDFGDGSPTPWWGVVDGRSIEHVYPHPGQYTIVTVLQLRDGNTRLDHHLITVAA